MFASRPGQNATPHSLSNNRLLQADDRCRDKKRHGVKASSQAAFVFCFFFVCFVFCLFFFIQPIVALRFLCRSVQSQQTKSMQLTVGEKQYEKPV